MLQDLRVSFRELRKRPGLAVTAIVSLTLGIGATTAVFSVIYGLLANPYPYQGAGRMIHLVVKNDKGDDRFIGITGSQLKSLRQVSSLESVLTGIGRGAGARAMAGEYHREEAPRYRNDRRLYRAKI